MLASSRNSSFLRDSAGGSSYVRRLVFPAVVLVVLLFLPISSEATCFLVKALFEFGHVLLFFCLTLLFLCLPVIRRQGSGTRLWSALVCFVTTALATESLQHVVGRSFQLLDLLKDALGASLAIALWHVAHSQDRRRRLGLGLVALTLGALSLYPLGRAVVFDAMMVDSFPMLVAFDSPVTMHQLKPMGVNLSLAANPEVESELALKVELKPGQYPGLEVVKMVSDWSGYQGLRLTLYNPQTQSMPLVLKLQDSQNHRLQGGYHDRLNRSLELMPGANDVRLAIDEITEAPATRKMAIDDMARISLFAVNMTESAVFYVQGIHLTGGP